MESVPKRQQTTVLVERLNGGKLRIERRSGSPRLYAAAYLDGKNRVKCTGEELPNAARKAAFDWYLEQQARLKREGHLDARLFSDCVDGFLKHADTVGEVSEGQRRNYRQKWSIFEGYFEGVKVTEIDASFLMNLRKDRTEGPLKKKEEKLPPNATQKQVDDAAKRQKRAYDAAKRWKRPTNATLKKDMNLVQLVLRYAQGWEKCIDTMGIL